MHPPTPTRAAFACSFCALATLGVLAFPAPSLGEMAGAPTKSREQERIYRQIVPPSFETEVFVADEVGQARAEIIIELYDILAKDPTIEKVSGYISPAYIQHNTMLPNGAPPVAMLFGASVAQYPVQIDVHKVAVVGDFAMAHVNFRNLDTEDPDDLGTSAVDMYPRISQVAG